MANLKDVSQRSTAYVIKTGRAIVTLLSNRGARIGIIVIFTLFLAWLSYIQVWQQLQDEIILPAGIPDENPELNRDLLRTINDQRSERVNSVVRDFSSFSSRFSVRESTIQP